ncbi:hypothetical protein [Mesorhizobium sp.]|uniref:hypothetical protein n=1 Tax=Mesorhizobium sp. TaxID=1871066 RepID=UPI000FE3FBFD|nr:hypothetical protein [Mesorhizobium sp.]RWB95675.1 MAG: hypothetical protein EOQ56_28410 [Mesorhizobium sp.]RWJ03390.1 MAG: hypothetical protein EOR24_31925 [Mesorhizobium sp.]
MSSSRERVAQLRNRRKEQGMKQSSIWLSPEDESAIAAITERAGMKSRSEAIRYALKQVSNQEEKMQA